jgi:hypothetical protein
VLYWGGKWSHLRNDLEGGLHSFVLLLSWIGILLKVVVLAFVGLTEAGNIISTVPPQFREKLTGKNYAPQQDEL